MERTAASSDAEHTSIRNLQSDTARGSARSQPIRGSVSALHREVGNQAVQDLNERGALQPKLTSSHPRNSSEHEADRVADAVPGYGDRLDDGGPAIQRQTESDGGSVDGETEDRIRSATRGGKPLPASTRSFFETRFGRDFSDVRVHTGSRADEAARALDAEAFAVGTDIAFRAGNYRPNTPAGKRLLAHELTHVVQQGGTTATVSRQATADATDDGQAADGADVQFRDCTEEVAEISNPNAKLQAAADEGVRGAADAISAIETYIHSGEPDESVRHAFAVHFSMPTYSQMLSILDTFREAQSILENPASYPGEFICNTSESVYCNPDQHGAPAYVLRDREMRRKGQEGAYIHICPSVFHLDTPLWNVLLHEAVHASGESGDCYRHEGCYAALPSAEAVGNADSYAGFAAAVRQ